MLAEATVLALIAGAALYVARPLFSATRSANTSDLGDNSLEDQKLEIYESLRDLEYDRQMQKISAGDYAQLRQQLTSEALTLLSQLDGKARPAGSRDADPLEEEIARYRANRGIREGSGNSISCPGCHHSQPKKNRFCGHCGRQLEPTTPKDNDAR